MRFWDDLCWSLPVNMFRADDSEDSVERKRGEEPAWFVLGVKLAARFLGHR